MRILVICNKDFRIVEVLFFFFSLDFGFSDCEGDDFFKVCKIDLLEDVLDRILVVL